MKSSQDRVPTHQLGNELALDAQGRVLRKPHFLTKFEHEAEMIRATRDWATVVTHETAKVREAREQARVIAEMKIHGVAVVRTHIYCRSRLHWLLRHLIKIR